MIKFEDLPDSFVQYIFHSAPCPVRYEHDNDWSEYGTSSQDFWDSNNDDARSDAKDYWDSLSYDSGWNSQMHYCTQFVKHKQSEIQSLLEDITTVQSLSH